MNTIASTLKNKNNLWLLFIIAITIVIYWPSLNYSFYPKLDDGRLILNNPVVTEFPQNAKAVFTEFVYGLYHPATTFSFIIDYKLFSDNPFGYRIHNLLLHLINTLLVFFIIRRFTNKSLIQLLTVAIFALHPLHIESVVWISERKDVLFTLYFLLSILFYQKYLEQEKRKHLVFVILFFLLSLLSKATAVVLPVVLILIDYYNDVKFSVKQGFSKWYLFGLSIVFGIINIKAQNSIDFIQPIAHKYTTLQFITIPVYSFSYYIFHLFAPINLTAKHLYPRLIDGQIDSSYYLGWLWTIITLFSLYAFRKNKLYVFGLLFYMVTIGLTIKLIPTGNDIVSERYAYVPYIGLGVSVGVLLQKLFDQLKSKNLVYYSIGILVLLMAFISSQQIKTWKNEKTIWTQVIKTEPEMPLAYFERGNAYYDEKDYKKASIDYAEVISLSPNFYHAYIKLGLSAYMLRNNEFALNKFSEAIKLNSENPEGYYHRGNLHLQQQQLDKAIKDFKQSINLGNNNPEILYYLAKAQMQNSQFSEAIKSFKRYEKVRPNNIKALNDKGQCYYFNNDFEKAIDTYKKILLLNPKDAKTKYYLANTYASIEDYPNAISLYSQVINQQSKYAGAYINRGNAYLYLNELNKACNDWETAYSLGAEQAKQMIDKYCNN